MGASICVRRPGSTYLILTRVSWWRKVRFYQKLVDQHVCPTPNWPVKIQANKEQRCFPEQTAFFLKVAEECVG